GPIGRGPRRPVMFVMRLSGPLPRVKNDGPRGSGFAGAGLAVLPRRSCGTSPRPHPRLGSEAAGHLSSPRRRDCRRPYRSTIALKIVGLAMAVLILILCGGEIAG